MITKMSHATVWVKNQQEALEFYRDKLGFEVDTDAKIGEDYRWLTIRIKDQPGFEIILMEPKAGMMLDEESARELRSLIDKGVLGGGVFDADDIYQTYDELKARGVKFKGPPSVQDWGTATVMMDNSGNWFSLSQHQEEPADQIARHVARSPEFLAFGSTRVSAPARRFRSASCCRCCCGAGRSP